MGEPTPIRDRNRQRRGALLASTSILAALAASTAAAQQVLPTHGSVASGAASIGQSGAALTITQTSSHAVINWNSFSIGAGNSVTFVQPGANAAALNRVTGSTPTLIAGRLDANGQVFIVNPNGIAITRSGAVNVGGGFVASTLATTNRDFNNGKLSFAGGGASAAVSNAGAITTGPGGFVGLIGGSVSNAGTINSPIGKVGLGSGEQATLDLTGDGFLQVALPTNAQAADGKALVDVTGTVKAAGGTVAIKAATAANAVRNAINLTGVASARSARQVGGSIVLGGGDGGDVKVSGRLDASGRRGGGAIAVTGHNVALINARLAARSAAGKGGAVAASGTGAVKLAKAAVDASGATGGGGIAIGGAARGLGSLVHAATTTIDAGSTLKADALANGDGGSIAVWSQGTTTVAGLITARGGALSGAGGQVETSGETAEISGATVDTTAAHGKIGDWLIDPNDYTIAASGGDISGIMLSTKLAATDVIIQSSAGNTAGAGDINVNDAVSWSSGSTLTLDAANSIFVNSPITVKGAGGVAFIYGDTTQAGVAGAEAATVQLQFAQGVGSLTFAGAGGSLSINGVGYQLLRTEADFANLTATPGGAFAVAADITLANAYTGSVIPEFYGKLEGLGHQVSNLNITQGGAETGLGFIGILDAADSNSGVNPPAGSLGKISNLFLENASVNGGSAVGVGGLVGESYGFIYNSTVDGLIQGTGSRIGGLVGINFGLIQTSQSSGTLVGGSIVGGLVGFNYGGVDDSLSTAQVEGDTYVGGVAGENSGVLQGTGEGFAQGTAEVGGVVGQNNAIKGDFTFFDVDYGANGTVFGSGFEDVTGTTNVGGVVGRNYGTVSVSESQADVNGTTSIGGLVGENDGAVFDSSATGSVTGAAGSTNVGGLIGLNSGSVDDSFATSGLVSGTTYVGGLVGHNTGTMNENYATTPVAGDANSADVGGLVGYNEGTITGAYALGNVSGATDVGGLVGGNDGPIAGTFAMGVVTGTTHVGGLVGYEGPPANSDTATSIDDSYSTGAVFGTTGVGGLVGATSGADIVTNAYWDTATSGLTTSAGGVPESTPVLQGSAALPLGTELAGGAAGGETGVFPYLASFSPDGVQAISGFAYTDRGGATPLASTAAGAAQVVVDFHGANHLTLSASTGANGYYYVFGNAGLLPSGANVIAYTSANTTTGATNAASYAAGAGANNMALNIDGSTFTETTALPSYSQLVTAVADAVNGDASATAAIAGVSYININATGAFLIDQAISTPADLTISDASTTLAADITATGGLVFDSPVTLAATVTVNSGTNVIDFVGAVDGSATPGAGLTVDGPVRLYGNVTTDNGAIAFNGPVFLVVDTTINSGTAATSFASTIDPGAIEGLPPANSLTAVAGALTFGGAIGGDFPLGAVSLTSTAAMTLPSISASTIFAETTAAGASLTLGADTVLTASGDNAAVTLVAAGAFVNNSGAGAIDLTGDPPYWLIYSNNPATDVFNNLNSNNQAVWNTTYPAAAPPTGDHYLFAYQPTVTFTSTNDAKTYGQDVTTRVATDYVVSGINPGVAGAYLPDTAATAYSGAPSVTSAGSPTTATVAGGPYAITAAVGSVAALDGYAVAFASPGLLSVGAEAITVTAAANTKTYDSTTSAAAIPTVTTGVLYDSATLAETYATSNAGTGITLNPTIAFTAPAAASNYTITLAPAATGVITPEAITVTASANTKTYDTTITAAALPTVTGTLYDGATVAETYATPNVGTGITLNPTIAFTAPAAASNYTVTLAPAATGIITPVAITVTATANTKTYDTTTTAAATPTVTGGTLYDGATFSETYATPNVGTGITLNPTVAFANPAAASNYTITLAPTPTGTITPVAITITATANTKTYDTTTTAAATPTVTGGTLYDGATFSETYATPNAGTGITLTPTVAFANPAAASNYTITLAPTPTGTITPVAITVTATTNTKTYDTTTTAASAPTVTGGTLYDGATFAETYATPNAGTGITLTPTVAFANPAAASNYAITLAPAATGVITPEAITVAAAANTKTYDATTAAAATPTVTGGILYDAATVAETYATANAGNGLQLNPTIAFATPADAGNYTVTLTPARTGVIDPEPITITATPNSKFFDGDNTAAALPTLTNGTLYDPATLSESYASINPAQGIVLTPAIAFAAPGAVSNYAVTLVPTGNTLPNTGVILPRSDASLIDLSPSVFTNDREPALAIPGSGASCGAQLQLPQVADFADPAAAVQAISAAAAQYVEHCRDASQEEIANALDGYADALQVIIQKLPPRMRAQLQRLPALVHAAAARARTAPTRIAAVRVLRQTVAEVHREIMLVRAEDPDSARIRSAVNTGVSGVLNSAALALARAEGI